MRSPVTGSTATRQLSPPSRPPRGLARAFLAVCALVALAGLLLFAGAEAFAAGRGGGGFSRGGGGGGFGRSGGGGFGRSGGFNRGSTMGGRSTRSYGGRQAGRAASHRPRANRMPSNRAHGSRTTRYPRHGHGSRTAGNRSTGRRASSSGHQPQRNPKYPPNCRGRNCSSQASNNPRPGRPGKPPASGCRSGYCPPGHGKPPEGRPPRRPPHYPPVVGTPPFYPPMPPAPPPAGNPPPPPAAGGGAPPPRSVAGGGGGGGGGPSRSARLPAYNSPPPQGENRYVPDQVICVLRDDLTEAQIDQFLADNRLARTGSGGDVRIGVLGVRVFRFRILDGRSVPTVMAALAQDPRGVSVQPNYVYQLSEMPQLRPVAPRYRTASGTPHRGGNYSMQYVIAKLRLLRAHEVTRGERVLIAVIDSGIDVTHPEIAGQVVKVIDVTEDHDQSPHSHGTAMAGAIVSHAQLMGVAPAASILAIRAFSPRSRSSGSGTSMHIALGIDKAVQEGARIINLSLAGPNDPMVQKAVEEARARGVVLVAAAGNNGPNAPPAYPAAYPEVIAVTATDSDDHLYSGANRGPYVAVAAPGVDVMVVAPNGAYGMSTGTSVAAAHISGIVALMLARNPMLDPDTVREMLVRSVRAAGGDNAYGAGYADAYAAVVIVDPARMRVPVAGAMPSQ